MPRVLCVDDNNAVLQNIMEIISEWEDSPLGSFEVCGETDFSQAVVRLRNERFDLVTLDLHGSNDPDPILNDGEQGEQDGQRVLNALREIRFVPVLFYTGYAEKIAPLESAVVKVVKKGEDDVTQVRNAIEALFSTGISKLLAHIEDENRKYIWDTLDKSWSKIDAEGESEDLVYLLARRLGARLSRDSVKELLMHNREDVRPIEMYIYPPHMEKIKTGCIVMQNDGSYGVIATPACDFAQNKADSILIIGAMKLSAMPHYSEWAAEKWNGQGNPPTAAAQKKFSKIRALLTNGAGDRYRFLPGTFFLESLVIDFQSLKQIQLGELENYSIICRLDSPFREELLSQFSRYYGRMGVPNLDVARFIESLD